MAASRGNKILVVCVCVEQFRAVLHQLLQRETPAVVHWDRLEAGTRRVHERRHRVAARTIHRWCLSLSLSLSHGVCYVLMMHRTSSWYCLVPGTAAVHERRQWMAARVKSFITGSLALIVYCMHCIVFFLSSVSLLHYLAIQPSRLQGCSNKSVVSCHFDIDCCSRRHNNWLSPVAILYQTIKQKDLFLLIYISVV